MTLEQAIRLLHASVMQSRNKTQYSLANAQTLGIEALKRLQDNRRDPEFDHYLPLPGETEEPT